MASSPRCSSTCAAPVGRSRKRRLIATALALAASVLLCAGCQDRAIPDPRIPHRLSRPLRAHIWVRSPEGGLLETAVTLPEGYWVASPLIVEVE